MSEKFITEKRKRTRVAVRDELIVSHADTAQEATLIDISRAGARLMTQSAMTEGSEVRVHFPVSGGDDVIVSAKIVRERYFGPGKFVSSVRFITVESADRRYFDAILDLYLRQAESVDTKSAAVGKKRQRKPKPTRRLIVDRENIGDLRGMVAELSDGGLTMIAGGDFALNDRIEVTVPGGDGQPLLSLKGTVTRHRERETSGDAGEPVFELGITFDEISEEQAFLLKTVVQLRPS